jgi:hypothetical protein
MGGLQGCRNNWDFCQQSLVVKFNTFCATQLGNSPQDITVIEVEQVSCEIQLEHPLPQYLSKGYQGKSEDNISEIQKLGSSPHVLDLDLVSLVAVRGSYQEKYQEHQLQFWHLCQACSNPLTCYWIMSQARPGMEDTTSHGAQCIQ